MTAAEGLGPRSCVGCEYASYDAWTLKRTRTVPAFCEYWAVRAQVPPKDWDSGRVPAWCPLKARMP